MRIPNSALFLRSHKLQVMLDGDEYSTISAANGMPHHQKSGSSSFFSVLLPPSARHESIALPPLADQHSLAFLSYSGTCGASSKVTASMRCFFCLIYPGA